MATATDADLILKLYDLRRESVCRDARAWFAAWAPKTEADIKAVTSGEKKQENAYMRQSTSYWNMAFSIGNSGALDNELLGKNCGEGIWFTVKCRLLKAKFPGVWQMTMAEGELFIEKNPSMAGRVESFTKRTEAQLN
jgi:hypothetical protein